MSEATNGEASASPVPNDGPNTLDTTLLESLFYNEIMMMDGDGSSALLSTVTGVGAMEANPNYYATGPPNEQQQHDPEVAAATSATRETSDGDPLTYAEQSLLGEFGVTGSPIPHLSDQKSAAAAAAAAAAAGGDPHQQQYHQQQHQLQPPPPPHYSQPYHAPTQYYHPGQPHQQTNGHHYHQPYPPPPPQQQHIQPRVSKGIKHSVSPRQSTISPQQHHNHNMIPNPLAQAQSSQPPHSATGTHGHPPPHYHSQHHAPAYNPSHPPPHQHGYHHYPASVPAPAPQTGHHPPSGFVPPPAGSPPVQHHQPHYSPPTAPMNSATPVTVHPHTPGTHAHSQHPPHPHPGHHHSHPPPQHGYAAMPHPPKEQLVSQFATLANRLGINLPEDLLSSLTESAGMASAATGGGIESTKNGMKVGMKVNGIHSTSASAASSGPPVPFVTANDNSNPGSNNTYAPRRHSNTSSTRGQSEAGEAVSGGESVSSAAAGPESSSTNTPFVDALRKTAEEAVAAVTRKRSHDDSAKAAPVASSGNTGSDKDKDKYAKRKKKPRLSDCEQRLAQLRAENETLKRHLDNITNKTEKFEHDRIKAEERMKEMMMNNETPDEELDQVICSYSEAYSDYGRRRHEELCFHLDQLQKLANPTNFTKMALWTMSKANDSKNLSDQNPLVGILGKELNVTPQQVRKMIMHRQRIRDLCSNLNATMALIHQLSDLCEQKNKKFNDRMTKTREILNPKQVVKLIMWIKDHTDVLGNICPGWTSEQVLKKKTEKPPPISATTEKAPYATKSDEVKAKEENAPMTAVKEEEKPCAVASEPSETVGADKQVM